MAYYGDRNWLIEVQKGNVAGHAIVNKFGRATDIDTGASFAVWDGKSDTTNYPDADYTWQSSSFTAYITSSDNGDTQDYEIQGLAADYTLQTVTQTAAGNTVTEVGTSKTWIRIFRVKNVGATNNAGIIFINTADNHTAGIPNVDTNIVAIISIGKNQTLMAVYTVPLAKTAILLRAYYGCGKSEDFDVSLCARPDGQVFQIKDEQLLYQNFLSNKFAGNVGTTFAAKTDIMIKAESLTNANKVIAAGFDLLLVDD